MDEFTHAVKKYERLCNERIDHSFWSSNLEEATVDITSAVAWQNFYSYLNDKSHTFVDVLKPSLGNSIDAGTVGDPYACDPYEYDLTEVQNGNVTIINVVPRGVDEEKLFV